MPSKHFTILVVLGHAAAPPKQISNISQLMRFFSLKNTSGGVSTLNASGREQGRLVPVFRAGGYLLADGEALAFFDRKVTASKCQSIRRRGGKSNGDLRRIQSWGLQRIGFQGLVTRFFHRSFTAQLVFDHISFLKGVFMKSKHHFGVRFDVARKFKNGLIPFAALLMMGSVVAEEPTSACPSCSTARSGAIVAQASPWGGGGAVPASPRSAVPVRSETTVPVSPKQYPNDIDPRVKPAPANCCGQQNIWNKDIIKKFFSFSQNPNNGNVSANAGFRFEPSFAWVQSMQTLSQFFGATLTPPGQMPNSLMVRGQLFKMNAPAGTVAYPPSWIDADSGLAIPCAALGSSQYPNTQITTRKELIAFWSGFNNNSNTYTNGVWNGPAVMSWPPLPIQYQAPNAWTMNFSHLSTSPALNPANDMVPGYFYVLKMDMELNHKKNDPDWNQTPVECPPICITMIKAIGGNTRVVGGAQIKEGFN